MAVMVHQHKEKQNEYLSNFVGHPYDDSFNAALAEAACMELKELGHDVRCHNLHCKNFDPVMPLRELAENHSEDVLVKLKIVSSGFAEYVSLNEKCSVLLPIAH